MKPYKKTGAEARTQLAEQLLAGSIALALAVAAAAAVGATPAAAVLWEARLGLGGFSASRVAAAELEVRKERVRVQRRGA